MSGAPARPGRYRPVKRLGQHFLHDPAILRRIVAAAGQLEGATVLEVGPGPGGLTRAILAARPALLVAIDADPRSILRNPDPFFRQIREGSQAFQGITDATLSHGEAFEFIELGKYHERASQTIRILDVKFAAARALPDGSPEATLQLIAMLKSCSAFEPFRRAHASQLQAWRVADFLLLHREFPRAVAFCLQHCLHALQNLSGDTSRATPVHSLRLIGRLAADLEYVDIHDLLRGDFHAYLLDLLARLDAAGDEITRTFFNTQVILTDPRQQQAQQQQ